ncbi:ATP-binding protein [uncultured Desulfovibrio sp.]|uniref:AAA family ATPase n=1 Tax=uncultured Desulfovibrio sp. TaxID=167968 RepID=UPI0026131927|nr:ATP-binding protein [uncultured Desulfovibrio sp.]
MLSSLVIKNFKSYVEAVIPLASMTFLIGPNASGKSNALEAFRLLSWLARGMRLDDIERTIQNGDAHIRGRAADLFKDATAGLTIGCRLDEPELSWNELQLEIGMSNAQLVLTGEAINASSEVLPLYRVEGLQSEHTNVLSVMYNNFKRGKYKPHVSCTNQQAIFYQLETPGRFFQKDTRAQKEIPAVVQCFREQLRNIVFLDPNPATMRGYSFAGDNELKEDGSNLSSVLAKLCQQPQMKQTLLDFIRSLPEQDITDISFITTERNDVMVRLHESFGSKAQKIDAPLLSDGTLRVLSVGAVLLSAPEKALVVIEEVDNGIHPSRADFLVKQIQNIASRRGLRVLISSHNPALLDAVPDTALGDVLCCYRNPEDGDSRIVRMADMKRFPELMAQGSLGQLMTSNRLEKFLKDTTSEEDRKQAALSWLERLSRETEA